jgi:outer membrane protein OmpA-like peptidoglycan-associated protein
MINRRGLLLGLAAATVAAPAFAQSHQMPSAAEIERRLEAAPRMRVPDERRVTVREFKRRPELRRYAPSIDIQSINFAFGSAAIPRSERDKVERIADGLQRVLRRRRRDEVFLIEGHTDAVGSYESNQILSEERAESLKRDLVRYFGIPARALETVGYGEEYLLVQTEYEDWRNRRVTIRRVTDFIR